MYITYHQQWGFHTITLLSVVKYTCTTVSYTQLFMWVYLYVGKWFGCQLQSNCHQLERVEGTQLLCIRACVCLLYMWVLCTILMHQHDRRFESTGQPILVIWILDIRNNCGCDKTSPSIALWPGWLMEAVHTIDVKEVDSACVLQEHKGVLAPLEINKQLE